MRITRAVVVSFALLLTSLFASADVLKLTVDDTIQPISQEYIERGLAAAKAAGDTAVLIELRTPGGTESAMRKIAGVSDVHDLHLWSIGSENHALSAHVKIADMATSESDTILREINEQLGQRFGIHHTTIQLEHVVCETAHGCVIAVPDEHDTHDHSPHDHAH